MDEREEWLPEDNDMMDPREFFDPKIKTNMFAYTAPSGQYPGYVSINRLPGGDVEVTVRSEPKYTSGGYICGFTKDMGKPGRCTPGDSRCNNYCNLHPNKENMDMPDHPLPCEQVFEGVTSSFIVPKDKWRR